VAVSATDNVGVVSIKLYIDGTLVGTVATATYTYTWVTTPLANGAHTLDAVATDAAGNATHALRSVTVSNNVKHAPVAGNDTFVAPYRSAATYAAQVFAILANDSDADGDLSPATVQITSSPNSGGTVKVNANGTVAYTPKQKYTGTETFRYTVKDLRGAVSNTATVTVSVGLTTASAGAR
jgi:hypothetical protein